MGMDSHGWTSFPTSRRGYAANMSTAQLGLNGFLLLLAIWLCTKLFSYARGTQGTHATKLNGPPSANRISGLTGYILRAQDISTDSRMGCTLRTQQIVVADPKALTHCYNSERSVYTKTESERQFIVEMFGRGVLSAEGDMHKRQRKALTPAFSNAAIRKLTSVFYDSGYKLKSFWDEIIDSSKLDDTVIEVQECLDSIGIAGFSHDFRCLDGEKSPVTAAFHAMEITEASLLTNLVFFLSVMFPVLLRLPTERIRLFRELRRSMNVIAERLLENTRREKEGNVAEEHTDKSVIGLLLKAQQTDTELYMTQEEVVAQLVSDLPYLDATVLEVLRMHPPLHITRRIAAQDDVIPLGTPIVTPSGETVTSIVVAKGSVIVEPIRCVNRSEAIWGPDAKEFNPERWFADVPGPTKELQGHRHLLTFHDGPRTCLGKAFALAEFKAVLSVLIRNYVFEFPDGPDTKIESHVAIVPRPKVAGQNGAKVPLKVRRV
ncbi:cytochrome P450 [Mycena leptocephala]|nr:cytochrome P450 [Mycena leptocephala]